MLQRSSNISKVVSNSSQYNLKRNYDVLFGVVLLVIFYSLTYEYGLFRERRLVIIGYSVVLLTFISLFLKNNTLPYNKVYLNLNYKLYISFNLLIAMFSFVLPSINPITPYVTSGTQIVFLIMLKEIVEYTRWSKVYFMEFIMRFIILFNVLSLPFAIYSFLFGSVNFGPFSIIQTYRSIHRLTGWFGSPNQYAIVLTTTLLVCLFLLLNRKISSNLPKYYKYILFSLVPINFSALILTGSRGSIISFLSGVLFFILFNKHTLKIYLLRIFRLILIGIVTLSIVFGSLQFIGYSNNRIYDDLLRLNEIEQQTDLGEKGRMAKWDLALKMFNRSDQINLVFGNGLGSFISKTGFSSHNGYLTLLFDNGYFFLFFFLIINLLIFIKGYVNNDRSDYNILFLSLLVSLLVKNFFNDIIPSNGYAGLSYLILIFSLSLRK